MKSANDRSDNPYTEMEGYRILDSAGDDVGEIEDTVYDAPSDVLKYIVVRGHPIPAEGIEVDAAGQRARVPYDSETIESGPRMEHFSGAFDEAVHEHYKGRG